MQALGAWDDPTLWSSQWVSDWQLIYCWDIYIYNLIYINMYVFFIWKDCTCVQYINVVSSIIYTHIYIYLCMYNNMIICVYSQWLAVSFFRGRLAALWCPDEENWQWLWRRFPYPDVVHRTALPLPCRVKPLPAMEMHRMLTFTRELHEARLRYIYKNIRYTH
jgi:hypothetical protein